MSRHMLLRFYGSGGPFILFQDSSILVNMSLLASNKLERTDKGTVTYTFFHRFHPELSLIVLTLCCYLLCLFRSV